MGKRKTPINWKIYNNKLVERGQKLAMFTKQLSDSITEVWDNELSSMNENKKGRKYLYPDSLVVFLLLIKTQFAFSYRMLEGFAPMFTDKTPDYSRINRRINKLPVELIENMNRKLSRAKTKGSLEIIADATGIQVNGKYVWSDERFKKKGRRKWKKLHLAIDPKTNMIVGVEVLEGHDNEGKHERVVDLFNKASVNTGKNISKVYLDGGYDSENNFEFFEYAGIKPVIRIRKDTIQKIRKKLNLHSKFRKKREREAMKQIDWKRFVSESRYGLRSGIEGVIGAFKRMFRESVTSKLDGPIEKELMTRVLLWNIMR